ncbi:MAG: hypothetical protein MJE63_08695 [Proteobacteria bacterium]|nr:hypothetical protein [Pseudomonadota bacterium]
MKGFFFGLTAGLAAGVVAQMMIAKNHEQMLELVKNLPRPLKFGPGSSLDDLLAQKDMLEDLIIKKQNEANGIREAEEEEEEDDDF